MFTDINSEDRLVQKTFAEHLQKVLGWQSVYAWNEETFGPDGTLGRTDRREVVLTRDLRAALARLNAQLPPAAITEAVQKLTRHDFSRSLLQHNQEFYKFIRDGVPVSYKDANGVQRDARARVIDFKNERGADGKPNNRFLAVRELKLTGLRTPGYNRRADLVCFVNGLPLVFIELKAVYKNIRAGFDGNLRDYKDEHVIAHAFHHNAFLIVSNGHRARYGSITSGWEHFAEWKRDDERDKGSVEAEVLLDGMLAHERLLDMVENFILFDDSKPGGMRKIIALNHQVLGVNNAVASVRRQEELKREFPPEKRLTYRVVELTKEEGTDGDFISTQSSTSSPHPSPPLRAEERVSEGRERRLSGSEEHADDARTVTLVESAHPDLGKLGVYWHTQGSGKSYSMAFFAEKVRRQISARFTFLLMADRNDLDNQNYRTFVGCGVANEKTPRASSGEVLKDLLKQNHRYIFSLIHKFNQDVNPREPYSTQDDIIVISDEAHRTQAGKLARNMRLALPNAAFIGFTGTPLFKHDRLIARANRVYPGKDFGLIVDYNGMLKSLREALAQYALGEEGGGEEEIVAPIEERVKALLSAIEETEKHLRGLGFEPNRLIGAKGFTRIQAIADGTEAVVNSRDEGRRRFEILARQIFIRFKALIMEPAAFAYAVRHDNIEAIYKKLEERRDTADVTDLLKELHRIVNEAIRAAEPGDDQMDAKLFDMSTIDLEKLRDEFAKKVKRKASALEDIRKVVEKKLEQMLARNPQRMDYYKKYSEIIADYNRDKDRVTIEDTFARLVDLVTGLDAEGRRAAEEGLSEDEYALFCLLQKENMAKTEREKVKLAGRGLLDSLRKLISQRERWTEKEQTQAEVEVLILDHIFSALPTPPFTEDEKHLVSKRVYQHVWQQCTSGHFATTVRA